MPSFTILGTVARTICQTKEIELTVEADTEDDARDEYYRKVESDKKLENLEDNTWDLNSIEVEVNEIYEVSGGDEEEAEEAEE